MTPNINGEELQNVISSIETSNYVPESLVRRFKGKVSNQNINESTYTILIEDISKSLSTVFIGCQNSKIASVTFYGAIEITPKQLLNIYNKPREAYSFRDDLYFYLFNEDRTSGNFILSFFDPSHKKIDVENTNEELSNLTVSWS
jgi:hypothetical protein